MLQKRKEGPVPKKKKSDTSLLNFRIHDADRRLFRQKAAKATKGNVSKLIIRAVKLALISKLKEIA